MNANSSRHNGFRCRAHASDVAVGLASLHRDLSTTGHQLATTAVADPVTVPLCPARALVRSGCIALDRVVELPMLAREATRLMAHRAGAEVVAQADRLAAVAADLAVVLRAGGIGFSGEGRPGIDGLVSDLGVGLGSLASLGPNETDEILILVAETLSLAARLVLVLARLHARRGRDRRAMHAFSARIVRRPACLAVGWTVRVGSLSLWTDLVHLWPVASIATWAAAAPVVLMALVARFVRSRPVLAVANLVGATTSAALPHPVLVVLALAEFLAGNRLYRSPDPAFRHSGHTSPRWVGFTSRPREASGDHREHHRDQ